MKKVNSIGKKLNLGCGAFQKAGFINVDRVGKLNPDVVHDLQQIPYPFKNDFFEVVEADHVLEHLSDPFAVMSEIHRITKDNGVVIIRVPHFSRGFTHPEHQRGFDVSFPLYFDYKFPGGYQGVDFLVTKIRLTWFAQKQLKRHVLSPIVFYALSAMGLLIDLVANLSPMICSKLWCFWVGGFEEIEFQLVTKKTAQHSLGVDTSE